MKNPNQGKNLGKAMLVGTALVSLSSPQQANAVTFDGAMSALVLAPIVVTTTQVLSFGSMSVGATGDTVAIDAVTGARTQGGGGAVALLSGGSVPNPEQRGVVQIQAATGLQIDIAVTATSYPIGIGGAGGATTMTVNNFVLATNGGVAGAPGAGVSTTLTLAATPTTIIGVGATLNVGANQTAGLYTGIYTVDVNYN